MKLMHVTPKKEKRVEVWLWQGLINEIKKEWFLKDTINKHRYIPVKYYFMFSECFNFLRCCYVWID